MEKLKTIEAIEAVIESFETDIADDYMLGDGAGILSQPFLKDGIVTLAVLDTGLPPAFVKAVVDLIYMTEDLG